MSTQKKRKPGFYFVKLSGSLTVGEYTQSGYWYVIGANEWFNEFELDEVNENILTP